MALLVPPQGYRSFPDVKSMSRIRRVRLSRSHDLVRSASVFLALLFVLLRPVCDVFAASAQSHRGAAAAQTHVQLSGLHAGDHAEYGMCCSSVDGHALVPPATPPVPAASPSHLAPASGAARYASAAVPMPLKIVARRDAAPPLSYHARSLRRLD
jgi:hypothetical protein